MAAVGIPSNAAKAALGMGIARRKPAKKSMALNHNAKVAISVIKMIKCWKLKCFGRAADAKDNMLDIAG